MALTKLNNNSLHAITDGSALQNATGGILQVKTGSHSSELNATIGSWVDTGLSLSITPSSTSSKILALYVMQFRLQGTGSNDPGMGFRLLRGSTVLESPGTTYDNYTYAQGNYIDHRGSDTEFYLDSPATTSAVTYKVQVNAYNGSTIRVQSDGNRSRIMLLEIAG